MKSNGFKVIALILWAILSVFLLICGSDFKIAYIAALAIGELTVFYGISAVFNSFSGWFLIDVGLGFMIYPVLKIIGINHLEIQNIKNLILLSGGVIALQLFFDDSLRNRNAKKRCTESYLAKCTSFKEDETETLYIPVYKYTVNGEVKAFYGSEKKIVNPKLGDVITVFVNKKNNNDVYCPTSKAILMVRYLIGLIVLTFSTGTIFMI